MEGAWMVHQQVHSETLSGPSMPLPGKHPRQFKVVRPALDQLGLGGGDHLHGISQRLRLLFVQAIGEAFEIEKEVGWHAQNVA
jgi:hypothetical protein